MNATPKQQNITVTSGAGSVNIGALGLMSSGLGIIAASATASYDVIVTDSDGYVIAQGLGLTGNQLLRDSFQVWGVVTISIANATVDGTYKTKLWFAE